MKRTVSIALVFTAAGLVACGGGRAPDKESAAGAPSTAAAPAASPLVALLPAKNDVPNWSVSKAPRTFTADNLWELIDGAADGFVAYGVQQVVTADYTQAGTGAQAVVELYEMKDPLNAYGKYSEERNPDYEFIKVGNEGYSGGTSVNFWVGQYYAKITTFEEKDAVKQDLPKLAQAIAAKVSSPGAEPREVSYFPTENQVAHSTKYIPKDVLAQSYLTNGFETRYKAGGKKESKLILLTLDTDASAQDALTRYRQFVAKAGKNVKDLKTPGEGGFAGTDSFYGNLAAVRAGKRIVVALGTATEEIGQKQIGELIANIK
ncbi:MAG: DUF6599 family protein [Bacteroidales bacterium]